MLFRSEIVLYTLCKASKLVLFDKVLGDLSEMFGLQGSARTGRRGVMSRLDMVVLESTGSIQEVGEMPVDSITTGSGLISTILDTLERWGLSFLLFRARISSSRYHAQQISGPLHLSDGVL